MDLSKHWDPSTSSKNQQNKNVSKTKRFFGPSKVAGVVLVGVVLKAGFGLEMQGNWSFINYLNMKFKVWLFDVCWF